jgi:hypothetical protein
MTYDTTKYGPPTRMDRHLSGPDAIPVGQPRTQRRTRSGAGLGFGLGSAGELYRMRTQSHLYDERDLDVALDLEHDVAKRCGRLLADCHACKGTFHVLPDTDRCPTCRTEF